MIPSYENFKDFKDAGEKILEYLHNHLGFALWMITRTESNDWIVLQAKDHEPYRVCRRVNILRDYPDDKIKIYP
ncbi:hypothetical protein CFH90_18140 (plasmid) [Acinetobacter johnsonii]|uniref:Uncharacterized protein n=1 Tax=Acinetobacter johnsonii TaxID=40214 RepID=A0A3Q8XG41_ACIJO|nr:hypothetical protein CFH90_18140 [Acinetobacter johnsonii]